MVDRSVGIDAISAFAGSAYVDVNELASYRRLDSRRLTNLLMVQKTVPLPFEDPVTFGVNAAKPIVDAMSQEDLNRIELLIACSESGIDFGKSLSTYIHYYLGLSRNCRLFEIKQACYAGTAGLQSAVNFVLSGAAPGAMALVIMTDVCYFRPAGDGSLSKDWSYAELASGAGAVALLVSASPRLFEMDIGASGYYCYEIMDTCRPAPDSEAGQTDLSMLSYLDCCEQTFLEYRKRLPQADYAETFDYLAYHVPFGGMVKGAHRLMMRKVAHVTDSDRVDSDFSNRVRPGLEYCQRIGNIMGGSLYLALSAIINNGEFSRPKRIGCFSYGSGCCAEFYSGLVRGHSQERLRAFDINRSLESRHKLSLDQYERIVRAGGIKFGTRNLRVAESSDPAILSLVSGASSLVLNDIRDYHRSYRWL